MARRALAVVVTGCALALLATLAFGSDDRAFMLGAPVNKVAVRIPGGETFCERGVTVPIGGAFRVVRLQLGTYHRPGPPFELTVVAGGRRLAGVRVAGGYPDITDARPKRDLRLDRAVAAGQRVDLCVHDLGRHSLALYGSGGAGSPTAYGELAGRPTHTDMYVDFFGGCDRSRLSRLPVTLRRAGLFKWQGAGTAPVVVLGLLALLLAPYALWRALGDGAPRRGGD
ncbi:MAG TPA: hypothetical protein VHB30_04765 [Solirubrobacteraceae bacterium]|nr:hypothetical protein [Solirubrobacteraceae bacterium]